MLKRDKTEEQLKQLFEVLDTDKNGQFSLYTELPKGP